MKKLVRKKGLILALIIIVGVGLFTIKSIFLGVWFSSHDGIFHVLRVDELFKMLKLGFFPVRWGLDLDNGYGVPIFNFVYPGPYYLAAIFKFFGISTFWALKLIMVGFYLIGGIFVFLIFRKRNWWLAILAALIYFWVPYQFLDFFVRGALGEVLAIGLIPVVYWSFLHLEKNELKWWHPLPLFLLLICHNFVSLIFLAFLVVNRLFLGKLSKKHWVSILLSLGLASFFLIPMIAESKLLSSGRNGGYTFKYDEHFVYPQQLLYGKWDYWYSVTGPGDGMSFQLGLVSILTVFLSIFVLIRKIKNKLEIGFLLLAFAFIAFLMTPYSQFIWKLVTPLQIMQFPWRLLFLTTFLTPLLFFEAINSLKNRKIKIILTLLLTGLAFYNVRNYRRPLKSLNVEEATKLYGLHALGTTTTLRSEVAPYWSVDTPYKGADVEGASGEPKFESTRKEKQLWFSIDGGKYAEIRVNYNYFPSWELKLEGSKQFVPIYPGAKGEIRFKPVEGVKTYVLRLNSTPIESLSNLITLAFVLFLIWLGLRSKL